MKNTASVEMIARGSGANRHAEPRFRAKEWIIAALLIAAFLLVRALVVICYWPGHMDPEELYPGTVARELVNGPILPIFQYQTSPKLGGSVPLGFFVAVAFGIMGPSYAAIKCVGVLFAAGGLLLWAALASDAFGRRTGFWYLAMAVLIPPYVLYCSLFVNDRWSFPEIVHALVLLLLCRITGTEESAISLRKKGDACVKWLFLLGLLLGLSAFLTSYFYMVITYSLLVVVTSGVLRSWRRAGGFLIGATIGMVPRIACNLSYNYWGLGLLKVGPPGTKAYFHAASSASEWIRESFSHFLYQVLNLVLRWIPDSLVDGMIGSRALSITTASLYELLVFAGIGVALVCMRSRRKVMKSGAASLFPGYDVSARRKARIIFGFFAFLVAITCFSQIQIVRKDFPPYRYILPFLPFYVIALAIFFDRMTAARSAAIRAGGWITAAGVIVVLLLSSITLLERWDMDRLLRTRGYNYRFLGQWMAVKSYGSGDPNGAFLLAENMRDPQDREEVMGTVADMYWFIPLAEKSFMESGEASIEKLMGGGQLGKRDVLEFRKFTEEKLDRRFWPAMYRALGRGLCWSHGYNYEKVGDLTGALEPASPRQRWPHIPPVRSLMSFDEKGASPIDASAYVWQGVGSISVWKHGRRSDWIDDALTSVPGERMRFFFEGVGAAWELSTRENGRDFDALLRRVPEKYRDACRRGRRLGFIRRPFVHLEI